MRGYGRKLAVKRYTDNIRNAPDIESARLAYTQSTVCNSILPDDDKVLSEVLAVRLRAEDKRKGEKHR